jgi:alanine-alpha-ketoisovalerate/valine-pyruvate aminotransferase
MTFSLFGDKFTRHSGITRLMEDLNDGLRTRAPSCSAAVTRRKFRR